MLALSINASYADPAIPDLEYLQRDLEYLEAMSEYVSDLQALCDAEPSLVACGSLDLQATDLNHGINTIINRRASQGMLYEQDLNQTYFFPSGLDDQYSATQIDAILVKAHGNAARAQNLSEQLTKLAGSEPR